MRIYRVSRCKRCTCSLSTTRREECAHRAPINRVSISTRKLINLKRAGFRKMYSDVLCSKYTPARLRCDLHMREEMLEFTDLRGLQVRHRKDRM